MEPMDISDIIGPVAFKSLYKNCAKPAKHPTNEMHILHLQMTTYHPEKYQLKTFSG